MSKTAIELGRINLETRSVLSPVRVNLEAFLKFSFEVSEGLDDLVAEVRRRGSSLHERFSNRIATEEGQSPSFATPSTTQQV